MNKLEKIIAIAATSSIIAGCASTSTYTERTPYNDHVQYSQTAISSQSLKIPEQLNTATMQKARTALDYLNFTKNYADSINQINNALNNKDFEIVESEIKSLASRLEDDPNRYAQQFLPQVKNFTYEVYQASEIREERTERGMNYNSTGDLLISTVFGIVTAPMDLALSIIDGVVPGTSTECTAGGESWDCTEEFMPTTRKWLSKKHPKTTTEKTIGKKCDRILVNPYSGSSKFIERDIPYSKVIKNLTKKDN